MMGTLLELRINLLSRLQICSGGESQVTIQALFMPVTKRELPANTLERLRLSTKNVLLGSQPQHIHGTLDHGDHAVKPVEEVQKQEV